jgi:hypothetical protein
MTIPDTTSAGAIDHYVVEKRIAARRDLRGGMGHDPPGKKRFQKKYGCRKADRPSNFIRRTLRAGSMDQV